LRGSRRESACRNASHPSPASSSRGGSHTRQHLSSTVRARLSVGGGLDTVALELRIGRAFLSYRHRLPR
jgi:hypothetical protein